MKAVIIALAPVALGLAGCATTGTPSASGYTGPNECKPEKAQRFVGQKASTEVGNAVLKASGAGQLRWGPPRSGMTMDLRPDRVTVAYNDAMTIERVTCG